MALFNTGKVKEISTRADIESLVDKFYKKVIIDDSIGFFFNEVVKLVWDRHIPTMYNFWETTLLGNVKYKGNPMLVHMELDKKSRLRPEHFDRWLALWEQTILENFHGTIAEDAKRKAKQIGGLMKFKVDQQHS